MSERRIEYVVSEGGSRLDRFLADHLAGLSRSAAQRLIEQGLVTVNGAAAKVSYRLRPEDTVVAYPPAEEAAKLVAEPIRLSIVYEDQVLLVVDKPAGMVVHPAPGHGSGTLVNALLAHCPELALGGPEDSAEARPGIVHRLDRDTSGLILIAKNEATRRALQRQFRERQVRKSYLALLHGYLQPDWGRIEAPLGRDPNHRKRMAVLPGGREAVTEYRVLEHLRHQHLAGSHYTLVEARPETGRTHQIRVHLASIGHPVVADAVYGRRQSALPLDRQFLHAWRLAFRHPATGHLLEFEAPLAQDLAAVLEWLGSALERPHRRGDPAAE